MRLTRPEIGAARNITIGGLSADRPLTGVGMTPVLRWDPPAFGEATRYSGVIWDFDGDSWTYFQTEKLEWVVPPGSLRSGHRYELQLDATEATRRPRRNTQSGPSLP